MGMELTSQAIIDEARKWLGTPYKHQGRQLTVAVDCIGLVFGVLRNLGVGSDDFWRRQSIRWGRYKRVPDGHTLHDGFSLFLPEYPPAQAEPGDMLLISFAGAPRHTAILSERNTIIHAHSEAKGCVENTWSGTWKHTTTSAFRLREVDLEQVERVRF